MKNSLYYICDYCYKEYQPKRRRAQRFCCTSCRVKAHHQKKKAHKSELSKDNDNKLEAPKMPNDKITMASVGGATAGSLIADGIKSVFTPEDKKAATKGDLKLLAEKLTGRYFPINNLPPRSDGTYPYFDIVNLKLIYLKPSL